MLLSVLLLTYGCASSSGPVGGGTAEPLADPQATHSIKRETSSPLILQYGEKEWRLDLSRVGYDGIDPTTLDRDAFYRWFARVERAINRPPQSAHFRDRKLIPQKDGLRVERGMVDRWLDQPHAYLERPQEVPVQTWRPQVTTAMLKRIKQKQLASYTTVYDPSHRNRSHNIDLSVKAIDHQVVPVGEVFSFNRSVGVRSKARGYRPAKVIVRGEYTEGVGGGICQTSSTLYNSVERAGLRILQRVSHSKYVTYVPKGKDATVSWGGPDFVFQNQLNQPILVSATAKNGVLTVKIFGPSNTIHQSKKTKDAPKTKPDMEEVPAPEKKQSIREDAKKHRQEPLPLDRLSGTKE